MPMRQNAFPGNGPTSLVAAETHLGFISNSDLSRIWIYLEQSQFGSGQRASATADRNAAYKLRASLSHFAPKTNYIDINGLIQEIRITSGPI
jgi:hypothetical protein